MTYLSLFLLFSSALLSQDQRLNGKWWLESIHLADSTIQVESNRFYILVDGIEILFNKEKNNCGMKANIKDGNISDCRGACTKVCCDDWYGTTSQYFNMNGKYSFKNDKLYLLNKWGTLIYHKADD